MTKRIRVVVISAALMFVCVNGFCAEQAISSENITDEQMNWPQKYKMSFSISSTNYVRFHLFDETYKQEAEDLQPIIALTDERTKDLFNKFVALIKKAEDMGPRRSRGYEQYLPQLKKLGNEICGSYNAFVESGNIESKRIREYFKKFYLKEEQEKQEDLARNRSLTYFIGVKFSGCMELGGGLYAAFLFPTSENLKIGFSIDLLYRKYAMNFNHVKYGPGPEFVGTDISFSVKINWFNLNIGIGLYKNVSGEYIEQEFSLSKEKVSNSEYSTKVSLGWMYDKKVKIFAGVGYRFVFKKVASVAYQHSFVFDVAIGF